MRSFLVVVALASAVLALPAASHASAGRHRSQQLVLAPRRVQPGRLTGHRARTRSRPRAPQPKPQEAKYPETFNGSCEFSGSVEFTPPMTTSPQPVAQHAEAPGKCSGTFTNKLGEERLDGVDVTYRADSSGDQVSCAFGVANGTGALVFPKGAIEFDMTEYRGGATPAIRLTGKNSGEAWMLVTPSQGSDPAAAVQACNGAGLQSFDLDARMQTTEPISG